MPCSDCSGHIGFQGPFVLPCFMPRFVSRAGLCRLLDFKSDVFKQGAALATKVLHVHDDKIEAGHHVFRAGPSSSAETQALCGR